MARRSKRKQKMISGYQQNTRQYDGPGVPLNIDAAELRRYASSAPRYPSGLLREDGVPNVPITIRDPVKTRFALAQIPNPKPGDAVEVELYKEFWCYYNGAWHCTVAPAQAQEDPDRKDLLVKTWAWGP